MFGECLYLIKTLLNFTSIFLDQNNPKSKSISKCKKELIHISDFEAVQKNSHRLVFLNLIIHSCSFFKQYNKGGIIPTTCV